MLPPTESTLAFGVGVVTHLLYFSRGEHHLHPQHYPQAFALVSIAATGLLLFRHGLELSQAIRIVGSLGFYFVTGLYASLLVYRQFFHPLNKFPGPLGSRISGLFLSIGFRNADSAVQYRRLHEKYGDFVRVGSSDLSIIHPKGVTAIYGAGSPCIKGDAYDATEPLRSLHSFRDRQSHDNRRRVWSSAFGDSALRGYEKRIRQYRDELIAAFAETKGNPINVTQWFNNYSFDVVGDLAFGQSFDMLENNSNHWAVQLLAEGFAPLAYSLPTWLFRLAQCVPGATKDWFRFLDFCRGRMLHRIQVKLSLFFFLETIAMAIIDIS
jgi:tryprostatin B 6-hydroxylase